MERGTQIAFNTGHGIEYGFVMNKRLYLSADGFEQRIGVIYCRFWRNGEWGILRTTANSEMVYPDQVEVVNSGPQHIVDSTVDFLLEEERKKVRNMISELFMKYGGLGNR